MSARLKRSFGFYTGIVYQSRFMVNHHNVELNLLTVSDSNNEQNIAYERMKYWIQHVMDDCILISSSDPALDDYSRIKGRMLVLPDDPVDQIVGIMLYLKLNAIMENRLVVTDTEIWSTQGDHTSYMHSVGENLGDALGQDGWWSDPRPIWSIIRPKEDGKIVNLDRTADWKDYGLGWDSSEKYQPDSVVFAKFDRDENQ